MEKLANTIKMFVAITKTLDDESTRFTGIFKHEQKKAFTNLLNSITLFNSTVKANMYVTDIDECEKIQDYIHGLIYDMINDGAKDLNIFIGFCRVLKTMYLKYVYSDYKHKDRLMFVQLYNNANYFTNTFSNDLQINTDIENFCLTLITGETFTRIIK